MSKRKTELIEWRDVRDGEPDAPESTEELAAAAEERGYTPVVHDGNFHTVQAFCAFREANEREGRDIEESDAGAIVDILDRLHRFFNSFMEGKYPDARYPTFVPETVRAWLKRYDAENAAKPSTGKP